MSDLLIRSIESEVADELKGAAGEAGRSVQAEARGVLKRWADERRRRREFMIRADAFRERLGPLPGNSADDIREDRDSGPGRDV